MGSGGDGFSRLSSTAAGSTLGLEIWIYFKRDVKAARPRFPEETQQSEQQASSLPTLPLPAVAVAATTSLSKTKGSRRWDGSHSAH